MHQNRNLFILLIIMACLLCFGVLKNISYPLLWNDEAECVMHGKRVLEYGYPKVHDGKNVVYPMRLSDKTIATHKNSDAYIGIGWSMFYYSVIGIVLAENSNDLYTKTALLRIPFAILGLIGLWVFAMSFLPFFTGTKQKLLFLILYTLFCLFSVSLLLHLREARYYSIVIFLGACCIYLYLNNAFTSRIGFKTYFILSVISLWLLFNTHIPVFFIVLAYFGLYEVILFFIGLSKKHLDFQGIDYTDTDKIKKILKANFRQSFKNICPLIIAFVLIIPLLIYFNTFHISSVTNKFYNYNMMIYFEHLLSIFKYFTNYEFLLAAIVLKVVLFILNYKVGGAKNPELKLKLQASDFISGFFVFYIMLIASFPSYIFIRYIVLLLPALCIVISLDIILVFDLIKLLNSELRVNMKILAIALLFPVFLFSGIKNLPEIKGRVYEVLHQYRGPLDYIIPYIKNNYRSTENLVIAANYEECSYMYYLNSKVTFGFILNNLEEDKEVEPDIIIYRKEWGWNYGPELFTPFIRKSRYEKISFPVYDYPTNNIPDIAMDKWGHLYKTLFAKNQDEGVKIFISASP